MVVAAARNAEEAHRLKYQRADASGSGARGDAKRL